MTDQQLLDLIKEIRDTCGIDETNPDFNLHMAKTTFNYLMRRKEVNEYVAIITEVIMALAPQLPGMSGVVSAVSRISMSPTANPVSIVSGLISQIDDNHLPELSDPPIDWFWSNLDNETQGAEIL